MYQENRYSYCGRKPHEHWIKLKIVTCNISEIDLKFIQKFREAGIIPSRSEYVRIAIRNQINRDMEMNKFEEDIIKGKIKLDPEKFILVPGYNGNKPVEILRRLE